MVKFQYCWKSLFALVRGDFVTVTQSSIENNRRIGEEQHEYFSYDRYTYVGRERTKQGADTTSYVHWKRESKENETAVGGKKRSDKENFLKRTKIGVPYAIFYGAWGG